MVCPMLACVYLISIPVWSAQAFRNEYDADTQEPYNQVQLVGLSIYTNPENYLRSQINNALEPFYEGVSGNNSDDAKRRVDLMAKFLDDAHHAGDWDDAVTTLKVFMAPEFFFRGAHGAYDDKADVMYILNALQAKVQDAAWNHWLFVFGTIVAHAKGNYYNFAPVMIGGLMQQDMKYTIIAKKFISEVDFLSKSSAYPYRVPKPGFPIQYSVFNDAYPDRVPKPDFPIQYSVFNDAQRQKLKENGFVFNSKNRLTVNNIEIGLEICLDHDKNVVLDWFARIRSLDLLLVTSAGMTITWEDSSADKVRAIFLQDGSSGAETEIWCPACPCVPQDDCYWGDSTTGKMPHDRVFTTLALDSKQKKVEMAKPILELRKGGEQHRLALQNDYLGGAGVTSCPRSQECGLWSPLGWATHGTGYGLDDRFNLSKWKGLFALENFHPQIHVGPALQLEPWSWVTRGLRRI